MPAPSTPKLYADDLKAYCCETVEAEGKCFQETLTNTTQWAETWQLPISTEKSKWLLITNKKGDRLAAEFEMAGVELLRSFEVVDLGINFNSKLDFSDHISSIIAKAKQRLFVLKKFLFLKTLLF